MKVKYVPCGIGEVNEGLLTKDGGILADELDEYVRAAKGEKIPGYVVSSNVVTWKGAIANVSKTFTEISEAEEMLKLARMAKVDYKLIHEKCIGGSNPRIAFYAIAENNIMVVDLSEFEAYNIHNTNMLRKLENFVEDTLTKAECGALLQEVVACK